MAYTYTPDGAPPGSGYPPPSQREEQQWNQSMNGSNGQYMDPSRFNPSLPGAMPHLPTRTQTQVPIPLSQDSSGNSIPYPPGDPNGWEEQDLNWFYQMDQSSAQGERISPQDHTHAVRKQRRIESERRYRDRNDFAYTELTQSFGHWASEIPSPTKKTKEAQLKHAAKLIKKGAEYSLKYKALCAQHRQTLGQRR